MANSKQIPAMYTPGTDIIFWAAGYMEGEASFTKPRDIRSGGKSRSTTHMTAVCSVDIEPLEALRAYFGGNIRLQRQSSDAYGGFIHKWYCTGPRARGVMLTMYPLLSRRRKAQITKAINA
jgi:hypothetical protein